VAPLHCGFVTTRLVHITRRGPVRTLTLDSPHNRNALSAQLLDELADGLAEAVADAADAATDDDATDAVRVVVLTATGPAFCSGADLTERSVAASSRLPEILTALRTAPVPVVARVNGPARAGGLGLIAASDLAAAPAACTFAFSEVRVGVAPAMILVPSLRVAAPRFLARAALTGEPFGAVDAAAAGLLTAVLDDEPALDEWVGGVITSVLKSAPGAVSATKTLLRDLPGVPFAEGLAAAQARSAELFAGAEAGEGMEAFLAKRRPAWDVTAP
jgi:methylglutaconyl-CoA hydratase